MTTDLLNKSEVTKIFGNSNTDTGSTAVQIALLTGRINSLVDHLKVNKKDFHSKRGLLMMVGKRRRLMRYLRQKDFEKFQDTIKKLDLKDKV